MIVSEQKRDAEGKASVSVTLDAAEFNSMVTAAFNKQRQQVNIPGFRKGKVPRSVFERYIGKETLFYYAIQDNISKVFEFAADNSDIYFIDTPAWDFNDASPETGVVVTFISETYPEISIENYKGLKLSKHMHNVTDEMVMARVEEMRQKIARMIDLDDVPVATGNIAVIDYEGYIDGTPFEGGNGKNFSLEIGSNTFIPGFEDQIIGHKSGEKFDVTVNFPEDYNEKFNPIDSYDNDINDDNDEDEKVVIDEEEIISGDDSIIEEEIVTVESEGSFDKESSSDKEKPLAGREAVFKITLNQVQEKELPALDNDFAMDVSEYDTLDELKESIRSRLEEDEQFEADSHLNDQIRELLAAMVTDTINQTVMKVYAESEFNMFASRMQSIGITLDSYLSMFNTSYEDLIKQMVPRAEIAAKSDLALEYVARTEGLSVTDEQYEKRLEENAAYFSEDVETYRASVNRTALKRSLLILNALDVVKTYAEITEETHDISEHEGHSHEGHDHGHEEHDHDHSHNHEEE